MKDITLVTTTRNRALAFGLLEKWMARQTVRWDRWLVINDGTEDYTYTQGQEVIKRVPVPGEPHSLCSNWLCALDHLGGSDLVLNLDDDDWYRADFVETMAGLVRDCELVGVNEDLYFNLATRRFIQMRNMMHASLACTAFQPSVFAFIRELALRGDFYIDMGLWYEWKGASRLVVNRVQRGRPLHVGIKGMPGERGLGVGHEPLIGSSDRRCMMLTEWLGSVEARPYVEIANKMGEP